MQPGSTAHRKRPLSPDATSHTHSHPVDKGPPSAEPQPKAKYSDTLPCQGAATKDLTEKTHKAKYTVLPPTTSSNNGNNWNKAEFGSTTQKHKFLRLMGSTPRTSTPPRSAPSTAAPHHPGPAPTTPMVFADPEPASGRVLDQTETQLLNQSMERQFEVSRHQTLSHRTGLGYHS
eukprot:NODE_5237_length_681_cov_15.240072_g5074_i0.p1 GENE.NODE_5237_length_681_cov_15.240072_g5074_i0~~NODE_5237_length_681_cov_15.240072_g5074_i0.p1  ORF type:complete len:191 (-),score=32.32 NODE_5237_length_681_cov_15.240072_g5074_i0:107-631(-)